MDLARLNVNVGGRPSPAFPGTAKELREEADRFDPRLPVEYLDLIAYADGGGPEICVFPDVDGISGNDFGVDSFYSFANRSLERVTDILVRWRTVLGPDHFPIGRDGGNNQIYIDLSDERCSVWIYYMDDDGFRAKAADSFVEFIDALRAVDDDR